MRPRHVVAAALGIASVALLVTLFRGAKVAPRVIPSLPKGPDVIVTTGTVADGDVFSLMLKRAGANPTAIPSIEKSFGTTYNLRRIRPGHSFELVHSTGGVFRQFTYRENPVTSYTVDRSSMNIYTARKDVAKTHWVEKKISGDITDNMYRDLMKQGYDENFVAGFVADLADNIFGWRIDFFTEQRPGDSFDVLMEQEYLNDSDRPTKNRRILSAIYHGKATHYKENIAIRFQASGEKSPDYYDENGGAVRRAFLRAPFTHGAFRVSSGFNPHRFHPILRIYRPHHGTDYAAAIGTPVAAIGKGQVVRAGWASGYGNCVDIRHNATYTSRYGHLSRVAVHVGQSVEQGRYIGNVGNTGLSTGPHLHFEMLVNGTQRNFLSMTFPAASAVSTKDMAEFQRARDQLLARLKKATDDKPVPLVAAGPVDVPQEKE